MDSALGAKNNGESQPATIVEAYNELSQEAFAVWMRLLCASDSQLAKGRGPVGDMLGYSEGRSNAILRELKLKGYIAFVRGERIGFPTVVKILRKALISGPARIIRLGKAGPTGPIHATGRERSDESHVLKSALLDLDTSSEIHPATEILCDLEKVQAIQGAGGKIGHKNAANENSANLEMASKTGHEIPPKKKRPKQKFIGLEGGYSAEAVHGMKREPQAEKPHPYIDLSKIKESKEKQKEIERKRVAERKRQKAKREKQKSDELTRTDKRGNPSFSFDCSESERAALIVILNRPRKSPQRKLLIKKLATEATRIYVRYRRETSRTYEVAPDEKQYMEAFGENCIRKGVTPSQALEYWSAHIHDFANSGLDVVPPYFFKNSSNVDKAAIALMSATKGGKKKYKRGAFNEEPTPVHSYEDTSKLHPRLRSGLESAGHDVSEYSDRALMSIQSQAKTLAAGYKPFISSKTRAMAEWAAEHIFKKGGTDAH